ncbi:GTP cyclohydrolase I [Mycobacterium kansasii]|uniref:GTP cyclohydrolase 1 n=6 Tax=Mycobacterium kansasii TaxID=1768 RepID=A0A653EXP3_MYCKA|nr:GTP cyclohydrolase I [Mycobacterium kansasii]KEP41456.1 GTP cyclohydrolase [Mycobacterium kansasii]UCA19758.1 GTP cyclohydrolase I [Mycobacterium kansasii]UGT79818.1 GTP cyclohydrolase I [Mycobacterium kansasii]UGT88887.1 GTP cyclohydrolase I [Mycobacterium kansasii]UGU22855.1 GTP cyclohydrolase I [Mycobacterium kansasii]
MTAIPSAPRQARYQMPPFCSSGWAMTNDEVAQGAAAYPADIGYQTTDSPAWWDNNADVAVERAVRQLLSALGVDEGEHTAETPARVARAWREMLWGYNEVPEDHLDTDFPAPDDPGLIIMHGISFASTCAHHLLPFSGTATIAYRPHPGQRIVGLSKLARLVHGYAARLQVQENIGHQATAGIMRKLNPSGAMSVITARHDCMRLRGVREPAAEATTESRKGMWPDREIALVHRLHAGGRPGAC